MDGKRDAIVHRGKYLEVLAHDGWEYVRRPTQVGAVAVVAVTAGGELVMVEQFRVPIGGPVIELPAGLAGDAAEVEGEPLVEAARRELLEETGYSASQFTELGELTSSPGLTDETIHLFKATGLEKTHEGGGIESERILVHCVKLAEVTRWLAEKKAAGCAIDAKVYAALYFARDLTT